MGEITSIRLHKRTKGELNKFKIHSREPHEDVIKRLMAETKKNREKASG